MDILIYEGMLGREKFLCKLGTTENCIVPHTNDLISIGEGDKATVYRVLATLFDYAKYDYDSKDEINVFVEELEDW